MLVPLNSEVSTASRSGRLKVTILGATGSIGRSTLEVIRQHPERFELFAATAEKNLDGLLEIAAEFKPRYLILSGSSDSPSVSLPRGVELRVGQKALTEIASFPDSDVVVLAIVGLAALPPLLGALGAGRKIALANKESVVCAASLVAAELSRSGGQIIPVDSEHSALFQLLDGGKSKDLKELVLTASGGPFLNLPYAEFKNISPEAALRHPKWSMGAKISVDSATMFNKALEVIEANKLFGVPEAKIRVLVHPQSIVHSLVNFVDGTQFAQLSVPDMKGPIAFALNYPEGRLESVMPELDLAAAERLEFMALDSQKFPAVDLARQALRSGGAMPAVLNIANEVAVEAFLKKQIGFNQITVTVSQALDSFAGQDFDSADELLALDKQIRAEVISWF